MTSPKKRGLNPTQRYMLSLLNHDGELHVKKGNRLMRSNGSPAGYTFSAQALVLRGLAIYAEDHVRLLPTPAGLEFFKLSEADPAGASVAPASE